MAYRDFNLTCPTLRAKGLQLRGRSNPVRRTNSIVPDIVTAIFLLLAVVVIVFTVLLIADPGLPLNPLAPSTFQPRLVLATDLPTLTPSITPTRLPATYTPTASDTPTPSDTPTGTSTPTVTASPVLGISAPHGTATAAPASANAY